MSIVDEVDDNGTPKELELVVGGKPGDHEKYETEYEVKKLSIYACEQIILLIEKFRYTDVKMHEVYKYKYINARNKIII